MSVAVLCVDDDPGILAAYGTFLGPNFSVTVADGGEAAMVLMAERGPFAVVVSDLHMPGTDGIRLLAAIRERHPDTVRVLTTGQPDLNHAMQAVNDGHVFRFLTKPIPPAALRAAVTAAADQYQLILSDRRRTAAKLQASEDRYRRLFDAIPHPMWVTDADHYAFLELNAAAVRQYGYSRAEFLALPVPAVELPNPGPDPSGSAAVLRQHLTADGTVRQVEVSASPIEFEGRPACPWRST